MQNLCKLVSKQVTKCKHFANRVVYKSLWNILSSGLLVNKKKYFAIGKKLFTSGLQANKTLCKWISSGLQVVHKPLASYLLASKPMQALSKLVC